MDVRGQDLITLPGCRVFPSHRSAGDVLTSSTLLPEVSHGLPGRRRGLFFSSVLVKTLVVPPVATPMSLTLESESEGHRPETPDRCDAPGVLDHYDAPGTPDLYDVPETPDRYGVPGVPDPYEVHRLNPVLTDTRPVCHLRFRCQNDSLTCIFRSRFRPTSHWVSENLSR